VPQLGVFDYDQIFKLKANARFTSHTETLFIIQHIIAIYTGEQKTGLWPL